MELSRKYFHVVFFVVDTAVLNGRKNCKNGSWNLKERNPRWSLCCDQSRQISPPLGYAVELDTSFYTSNIIKCVYTGWKNLFVVF